MRSSTIITLLILSLSLSACDGGAEVIELAEPRPIDPRLILSERQIGLEIGTTTSISSTFVTQESRTENPSVIWVVDDANVAEVSGSGEVSAKAAGQTYLTATLDGTSSYPSLITVVNDQDDLARIDMVPDTVETEMGGQMTLDFTAWTLAGNRVDNPNGIWSISDSSIGLVNDLGQTEGIKRGISAIEVTVDDIKSLSVPFSVFGQTKTGQLSGLGDYSASGEVNILELPGGGTELRLSDSFRVDAGPRLDVYISKTNRVNGDSVKLGLLSSFQGAQSFFVPSATNLDDVAFVIIHCTTYDMPFGRATMR